jgi:hypothetical protein
MHLAFAVLAVSSVLLTDAVAQTQAPPAVARYLKQQGPVIREQVFQVSEPREQLALWYCVDENLKGGQNEGASNPANVHCHVALFNRKADSWAFANRRSLGQGKVLDFANGTVTAQSVTYKSEDGLCCPSNIRQLSLATVDGKLVLKKRAP